MKEHHIKHQQGATMMLTLLFMIGILGMIGLAIDTGHMLVNKTRLQNGLDAAALSAAIILNGPVNNSTAEATAAGIATFDLFKNSAGNTELAGVTLTAADFSYSDRINLFSEGLAGIPNFVRVFSNALNVNNFFIQVITGNFSQNVGAVSTAGPMGQICDNRLPFVLCANYDLDGNGIEDDELDENCDDDTDLDPDGADDCYGYNKYQEIPIHKKFCPPNDTVCQAEALGPGNFETIRLDDNKGAKDMCESILNSTNICSPINDATLDTEPGYQVGPVGNCLNERFYNDSNSATYDQTLYNSATHAGSAYENEYLSGNGGDILPGSGIRKVAIPIVDCRGTDNGKTTVTYLGDMCALLRRPVRNTGPDKDPDYIKNDIYIEPLGKCPLAGKADPTNPVITGPFKIVLYKSENSGDS